MTLTPERLAEIESVIAKLVYMTSGRIGIDWRSGARFVLHEKGSEFEAICLAAETLRECRALVAAAKANAKLTIRPPAPREELIRLAFHTWDKFCHSPRIDNEPGLDRALRGFSEVVDAILKAQGASHDPAR